MKYIISTVLLLTSSLIHAEDIAFGTLKGIKVYGYGTSKVTKLYFSDSATEQDVPECNLVANLRHSQHSEVVLNQFVSIALSAYSSGKKIRAHSSNGNCDADFIALQESYF